MSERPILFSGLMVQAILDGRKSQTRRIVKPQPFLYKEYSSKEPQYKEWFGMNGSHNDSPEKWIQFCPYGKIGDILWVRETWRPTTFSMPIGWPYDYRATAKEDGATEEGPWKSPIFMPKEACRIRLKITNIRVERLQDISEGDAIAEGITELLQSASQLAQDGRQFYDYSKKPELFNDGLTAKESYKSLWESINGKDSWKSNFWVWCISFKKL